MSVAILGCGPAGLMAALAVRNSGEEPVIFSRKRKSPLYGAQYLHAPIPFVTDRDNHVSVQYMLRGTPDEYRRKVYGELWDGTVSPEDLTENHRAWDIRETYDRLWTMFEDNIEDVEVDAAGLNQLIAQRVFSLIINTIPLQALCVQGHQFRAQKVIAAGDAPQLGIKIGGLYRCPPDTVICNGEDNPSWYRISNIFGHTTVEWPASIGEVPIPTASEVIKPTSHNCDCWPNVFKVGRYGSWTKGVLSHTAYFKTMERMEWNGPSAAEAKDSAEEMPTLF